MFAETRPLVVLLLFAAGLFAGAFANLIVHRDAARVDLFKGKAVCPTCSKPTPFKQRLPVLSYVLGRGKRQGCGCKVRTRDPLAELVMGVAFAAIGARIGLQWILPALLAYTFTLVTISEVDLDERRIPNKVLFPMSIAGGVLVLTAAAATGSLTVLPRLAIGAAGYAIPLFLLGMIAPGSMGMGDVKLAAYIGMHLAWFSLAHVLVGAVAGFVIGAVVGLALIVFGRKGRKDTVPFGPSMALGGYLVLFVGEAAKVISG